MKGTVIFLFYAFDGTLKLRLYFQMLSILLSYFQLNLYLQYLANEQTHHSSVKQVQVLILQKNCSDKKVTKSIILVIAMFFKYLFLLKCYRKEKNDCHLHANFLSTFSISKDFPRMDIHSWAIKLKRKKHYSKHVCSLYLTLSYQ